MVFGARLLSTAAVVVGLTLAPAAHAARWHGDHHRHGGGGAAGAAIIGGLVGLGVGAAIASGGGYAPGYYAPPYSYYGPPPNYYTPPPPAVYYGY